MKNRRHWIVGIAGFIAIVCFLPWWGENEEKTNLDRINRSIAQVKFGGVFRKTTAEEQTSVPFFIGEALFEIELFFAIII